MRLALIVAFLGCVFLTTERADARPGGDRTTEAKKAQKRKRTPDSHKKSSKAEHRPKKAAKVEDDTPIVRDEDEAPVSAPKTETRRAAKPVGAPVAQETDDEIPQNQKPLKKRR